MTEFNSFKLPEKLRKYKVQEVIGGGAYGYVHRAMDTLKGRAVAVKFASRKDIEKGYFSLNNEIETLKRLQHENIINLIDFSTYSEIATENQDSKHAVLVLELCICDLKTVIALVRSLTMREIKTIVKQIFRSLEYLEDCQMLHCDVKPRNILLSSEGKLKLCDFGFSRPLKKCEENSGFTMRYSSPETLLGATNLDCTADSWSAGCIFAELFKGDFMFSNYTTGDQLIEIFGACGTFTPEAWQVLIPFLPYKFKNSELAYKTGILDDELKEFVSCALARDLLSRLLVTDPRYRWTAKKALGSPYILGRPSAMPDLKKLTMQVQCQLMCSSEVTKL